MTHTDYKVQSVNLTKEIGLSKAARELGISPSTLNGRIKATREGRLISAPGSQTPGDAMSLVEEIAMLREQNKTRGASSLFLNMFLIGRQKSNYRPGGGGYMMRKNGATQSPKLPQK